MVTLYKSIDTDVHVCIGLLYMCAVADHGGEGLGAGTTLTKTFQNETVYFITI